jgi:hypothetical protein
MKRAVGVCRSDTWGWRPVLFRAEIVAGQCQPRYGTFPNRTVSPVIT